MTSTYFHVTPTINLKQIMREGLLPMIGARSAQLNEPVPAIYLFKSTEAVEDACSNWLGECFDEDLPLALIAVEVDDEMQPGSGAAGFETLILQPIPPAALTVLSLDVMDECSIAETLTRIGITMKNINFAAITPDLIDIAVATDDLDAALSALQKAAGIEDGGVAGIVFVGDGEDRWPTALNNERRQMLNNWINVEKQYAEKEHSVALPKARVRSSTPSFDM